MIRRAAGEGTITTQGEQADGRGYRYVARIVREVVGREMVTEGQRLRLVEGEK